MRMIFSVFGLLFAAVHCNTTGSKIPFRQEVYQAKTESVLYIFRDSTLHSAVNVSLFFDGKSIGILNHGGYYPVHAAAGRHKLKACGGNLLMTLCKDIDLDLKAKDYLTVKLVYEDGNAGYKTVHDLADLTYLKNEGNYYDAALREAIPGGSGRVRLSAATIGAGKAGQASAAPLKLAILNFTDQTKSEVCGWLAESLPDAIDQSLRRDFEYVRPNPVAVQKIADTVTGKTQKQLAADVGTNLIISGQYTLNSDKSGVHIEARIYFADDDRLLGSEGVDAPLDAQIFNATKILSEKLVARMHQIVRKEK